MSWEQTVIQTSRGVFEIFKKGTGNPLAVTHLYSEYNQSGDYFAEAFMNNFSVHLINLRECGQSAKADKPYQLSMIDSILDLEAIREALGYESWSFAGHSTGAMAGVIYGIESSASLDQLILVGGAARDYTQSSECIYHPEHKQYDIMQTYLEKLKTAVEVKEQKRLKRLRTKLSLYDPERYEEFFNLPIHKKISPVRLDYFSRELYIFDVTRKLSEISAYTHIVCGQHDVQCPLAFSEEMAKAIPNSRLHVFHESNHYPFLEEQEAFLKLVKELHR